MKRAIDEPEDEFAISGTNATGGATKVVERFDLVGATVQCVFTSGSYLIQGSNDGSTWVDVGGGAITASGLTTLSANVRYLRIYTTTAGTAEFYLFAHEFIY